MISATVLINIFHQNAEKYLTSIFAWYKITQNDEGEFFAEIEWPKEGKKYEKSVKKLIPEIYQERALNITQSDTEELKKQEELRQKELAELLGCATATVTKYEKEQRKLVRLSGFAMKLERYYLLGLVRCVFRLTKKPLRANLLVKHPNQKLFTFYKLGYYADLMP